MLYLSMIFLLPFLFNDKYETIISHIYHTKIFWVIITYFYIILTISLLMEKSIGRIKKLYFFTCVFYICKIYNFLPEFVLFFLFFSIINVIAYIF